MRTYIQCTYLVLLFPSAVTGGLFRVSAGLKPAVGGTVLGVLLRWGGGKEGRGKGRGDVGREG